MGATIKDVAKEAGVSVMTVSRVINHKDYIADKTRVKVEKALKKLNYMPNMNARNLVTNKTDFLGIVVPDISNPFFGDLVKAAEKIAKERGYSIILGDSDGDPEAENGYIEAFRSRMCDAIILVAPRIDDQKIRELSKAIPLVLVDRMISDDDIIQVYLDNAEGAYSAVTHLINLGHTRIGFIMGPENVPNTYRRKVGYVKALADHGIAVDEQLIVQGDFVTETGERAFSELIKLPQRPTAVFGSNDLMAFGFVRAANEAGYSVPGDFSVVGFDDVYLSAMMEPGLTTVKYPIIQMGKQAINVLLDSLSTKETVNLRANLKHELIIRRSTRSILDEEQ
jgi:DNA-binding LacI/PurR family transcriptional regulator